MSACLPACLPVVKPPCPEDCKGRKRKISGTKYISSPSIETSDDKKGGREREIGRMPLGRRGDKNDTVV